MNENLIAGIVCAFCGLLLEKDNSDLAPVPFILAGANFVLWMA